MERDFGQIRVESPPIQHHQFFPGGGGTQLFPNAKGVAGVDRAESAWSSGQNGTNWNSSAPSSSGNGERAVQRDEWNAGSWRFDGGSLTAERVSRGAGAHSWRNQSVGENRRRGRGGDLGLQLDSRGAGNPEASRDVIQIDDDEEGGPSRALFGRHTPSPPSNEPNPRSRVEESPEDDGTLSLKLGGGSFALFEENGAEKRARSSSPQSQVPTCQVDGCSADLSKAKDYQRRHKVCEMHSKATTALVSRVMQRFCQQCSRFHPLEQFDEVRRSCRRRLAGHNKRRRKTQPEAAATRVEEQQAGVKNSDLLTLLGVLSQLKGPVERASAAASEQDLLLQCLRQAGNLPNSAVEGLSRSAPSWSHVTRNTEVGLAQIDPSLLASQLNGHGPAAFQPQDAIAMLLQNNLKQAAMLAQGSMYNRAGLNGNTNGGPVSYPPSHAEASVSQAGPQVSAGGMSLPSSLRMGGGIDPAQLLASVALSVQQSIAAQNAGQVNQMAANGFATAQPSVQRPVPNQASVDTRNFLDQRSERNPEKDSPTVRTQAGRARPASQNGVSQSQKRPLIDLQQGQASQRPSIDLQHPPSEQYSDASETGSGSGSGLGSGSASGSGSGQKSPGTPHIEWENNRISFKLFDKHPEQFPERLRNQIDEWLSHRPSDMEGFIRPGCVILTLFLSMPSTSWTELTTDLPASLMRLLSIGCHEFWCTGRILVQVDRQTVLIVDGQITECRTSDPFASPYVLSVRPLAVVAGEKSRFTVNGLKLRRLLCAFRGKYYSEEVAELQLEDEESVASVNETEDTEDSANSLVEDGESSDSDSDHLDESVGDYDGALEEIHGGRTADDDASTSFRRTRGVFNLDVNTFEYTMPGGRFGRCFIEVEQDTVAGSWKPVIVADGPVCREIRTLESEIERAGWIAGRVAEGHGLDKCVAAYCAALARVAEEEDVTRFLQELGWFFQRSYFRSVNSAADRLRPSTRLKALLVYCVERNWCAVVQRVLDIGFEEDVWEEVFSELGEMCEGGSLLHRAVRIKSRAMVELLLGYAPSFLGGIGDPDMERFERKLDFKVRWCAIFKADMRGPGGLSPLHVAASLEGGEEVVDALTSGPFQMGLHAWLYCEDDFGETPLSLALARGNMRSVQLVRAKLARLENPESTIIDVAPGWDEHLEGEAIVQVELPVWRSSSRTSVDDGRAVEVLGCRERDFARLPRDVCGVKGAVYRPFLVSIMGIACICVCVCLLLRGPQNVLEGFMWFGLDEGKE